MGMADFHTYRTSLTANITFIRHNAHLLDRFNTQQLYLKTFVGARVNFTDIIKSTKNINN